MSQITSTLLRRAAAIAILLTPALALAEPEQDLGRETVMVQRFTPFDNGGGPGWENAFDTPFIRSVTAGQPEGVPLALKPGAYMIVVLCNCQAMRVTLVAPGGAIVSPLRSGAQAAMYSLDVPAAGQYLTGIDLDICGEKACDVGIKVYHKKT